MFTQEFPTLHAFLNAVLDSDLTGEEVMAIALRCYDTDRKTVGQLWNNLLCAKHGI